jgi:hypothetical protein
MNLIATLPPCCYNCGSDAESIAIEAVMHGITDDPICCEI